MHRSALFTLGLAALLGAACSGASSGTRDGEGGGAVEESDPQGGSGGATSVVASSSSTGGPIDLTTGSGGGDPGTSTCDHAPDADEDEDGFTVADGDCNDCDPNVNPGALEVLTSETGGGAGGAGGGSGEPPKPADEDCDGEIDNVAPLCDDGLALDDTDPESGAKAIGICGKSDGTTAGLLEAKYVTANGSAVSVSREVGLLDAFGPNVAPRQGARMLGLSSGYARTPAHGDACGGSSCNYRYGSTPPPGFPQDVPNCSGSSSINDDVALEVRLKAPTNATGYKFLFDFYTFEFPEYVCSAYNDQFIALISPPPEGAINGNISFDSQKNPVSVNIAFFDVCQPSSQAPGSPCALGTAELQGTGFESSAGATGWLETQAPVKGGEEVTIRFAIWDTGDQALDSTVLVDGFEWIANGGTVEIGTKPNVPK